VLVGLILGMADPLDVILMAALIGVDAQGFFKLDSDRLKVQALLGGCSQNQNKRNGSKLSHKLLHGVHKKFNHRASYCIILHEVLHKLAKTWTLRHDTRCSSALSTSFESLIAEKISNKSPRKKIRENFAQQKSAKFKLLQNKVRWWK
jgi:hypothetical protein